MKKHFFAMILIVCAMAEASLAQAHINQPVDATLGPLVFQLSDPLPVSSNGGTFYRIGAVPLARPLDLDGDGIDDGYELRYRAFLNPFDPADAAQDFEGDGRSNLQEYRNDTDPTTPPSPSSTALVRPDSPQPFLHSTQPSSSPK